MSAKGKLYIVETVKKYPCVKSAPLLSLGGLKSGEPVRGFASEIATLPSVLSGTLVYTSQADSWPGSMRRRQPCQVLSVRVLAVILGPLDGDSLLR